MLDCGAYDVPLQGREKRLDDDFSLISPDALLDVRSREWRTERFSEGSNCGRVTLLCHLEFLYHGLGGLDVIFKNLWGSPGPPGQQAEAAVRFASALDGI